MQVHWLREHLKLIMAMMYELKVYELHTRCAYGMRNCIFFLCLVSNFHSDGQVSAATGNCRESIHVRNIQAK